jgi:hypothetical protein
MDTILPLIQPPLVLIKDFHNKWDWGLIENNIKSQSISKEANYNITESKDFFGNTLPNIKQDILTECKTFISNIFPMQFDFDLKMTSSWVNLMQQGDQHPWHSHPFSVVSGVIFLDNHPENSELTFKNKIDFSIPPYSLLDVDYYSSLKSLLGETPAEEYNLQHHLVLFYSNLTHGVPPLITPHKIRRTISFNTFWTNKVDFGTDLNSHTFL